MIRHMRHGSPPRLMALQSILRPNRRESLPAPSTGNRMSQPIAFKTPADLVRWEFIRKQELDGCEPRVRSGSEAIQERPFGEHKAEIGGKPRHGGALLTD